MYLLPYYLQTNFFCIIILLFIFIRLKYNNEYTALTFKKILFYEICFCLADVISIVLRGTNFVFSNITLYLTNSLYLFFPLCIGYCWIKYVYSNIDQEALNKRIIKILLLVPHILGSTMLILNFILHNIFTIDSNNLYVRGKLFYVYIIISWLYIIISTVKSISVYSKTNNIYIKEKIFPLTLFIIAPTITSIIQNLFYGLSVNQIGFTLSSLLIFLYYQDKQISIDDLTKINNRTRFNIYIQNKFYNTKDDETISLMFIDVDNFKLINDKYGHLIGDETLTVIATILRKSCVEYGKDLFLARYGGDEFVILSSLNITETRKLKKIINNNIAHYNKINNKKISVSIGYVSDKKIEFKNANNLIHAADELMYKVKKEK